MLNGEINPATRCDYRTPRSNGDVASGYQTLGNSLYQLNASDLSL